MPRKTNNTKYVGDCSPSGIAKQAIKVYKMSNAKNPIKNGIKDLILAKWHLLHNKHIMILANEKNK